MYGHIWRFSVCGHVLVLQNGIPDVTLHYDIVRVQESHRSYSLEAKFRVLHCVSAALHDCRVYHASCGELTHNDYQSGYYPSAVSSLVSDPCLLFMCTPEGSSSMKVVFNLLFSVTHA